MAQFLNDNKHKEIHVEQRTYHFSVCSKKELFLDSKFTHAGYIFLLNLIFRIAICVLKELNLYNTFIFSAYSCNQGHFGDK